MRKWYVLAGLLGLGPGEAQAQGAALTIEPWQVLGVLDADWTEDGRRDRAVLIEDREESAADLLIYVSGDDGAMRLDAMAPDIAWSGLAWGTLPEMTQNAAGSLQVIGKNEAIGRSRWRETTTIAWRGGQFVVAGFTFESYDTLDPGLTRQCDANFLAGRGLLDGVAFDVPAGGIPLEEWSPAHVPSECAAG